MRRIAFAFIVTAAILLSGAALATGAQTTMQCRDMRETGNFVYANETIVNGMACHVVATQPAIAQPTVVAAPGVDAKPAASQTGSVAAPDTAHAVETNATVYFYRRWQGGNGVLRPTVFVDDARVGRLHEGESIKFSLSPGDHRIRSTDKSTGMELTAKPGETYYVRIDIRLGSFKGQGAATLVDPQEGKYEAEQAARHGR